MIGRTSKSEKVRGMLLCMLGVLAALETVHAESAEISCEGESKIESNQRMSEDSFTFDNAQQAIARIQHWLPTLRVESDNWEATMAIGNSLTIIEGYQLRERVRDTPDGVDYEEAVSAYCDFLNTRAFHID